MTGRGKPEAHKMCIRDRIELKRNSASADLAAKVVGLIEQYEMEYQCSIQSADYAYLRQVNELNPDLTLGYILTTAIGNYYKNDMIDFFCVRSMFVNNTTVAKAHAQGKAVYAWTCLLYTSRCV